MNLIRAKVLERIISLAQENFGYNNIDRPKVYLKNKYVFLKECNNSRHIVLNNKQIEVVSYSTDKRESPVDIIIFEYIDDFLLYWFDHHIQITCTLETTKEKGEKAFTKGEESANDFLTYRRKLYDFLIRRFLLVMGTQKFFLYQLLLTIKTRRKEYYLYYTHMTRFSVYLLFILYMVIHTFDIRLNSLLFLCALLFISSGYLKFEEIYYEYSLNKKISITIDRIYGAILMIGLFIYALYF